MLIELAFIGNTKTNQKVLKNFSGKSELSEILFRNQGANLFFLTHHQNHYLIQNDTGFYFFNPYQVINQHSLNFFLIHQRPFQDWDNVSFDLVNHLLHGLVLLHLSLLFD